MRPNDMQSELLWEMVTLLDDPDLDAEDLGRVAMTLEQFVGSGLVTETEAGDMLADRRWRPGWSPS